MQRGKQSAVKNDVIRDFVTGEGERGLERGWQLGKEEHWEGASAWVLSCIGAGVAESEFGVESAESHVSASCLFRFESSRERTNVGESHNLVERVWDRANPGYDDEWKTTGCFLIKPCVFQG